MNKPGPAFNATDTWISPRSSSDREGYELLMSAKDALEKDSDVSENTFIYMSAKHEDVFETQDERSVRSPVLEPTEGLIMRPGIEVL
ncbi:hypothetical protein M7I_7286 [Glarea lozoyensis 74030]|uniref:Uncharacterized protein n=1 Tax=Glarea lozoyensis (strain ATCC 74030 / MF5533) TaxID=1104152 RepID=H0EWW1_GLAL7|nr:hypothetical protein M7I_7286 [Glarea lozoyensis 74030]